MDTMRAYMINPDDRTITAVDCADGLAGIRRLIGFDTVDSDEIDANGDRLFFDESCFIRQQEGAGRFRLDTLAPVAGRGVVIGSRSGGSELCDAVVTLDALQTRVSFA
jgi:hypothetical protein